MPSSNNHTHHNSWQGLTSDEVLEQRRVHGANVLPEKAGASAWTILFGQFKSPLVYIILVAAGISLAVGELGDFAIIMFVVLVDVALGFVQEYKAQQTYTALHKLVKPTTTVIRDGERQEVEVRDLVPDDTVILQAGEHVPGDGVVLEAAKLAVEEAILTGESEPIEKTEGAGSNLVYMGTTVVAGRGVMCVTGTGTHTELGKIAVSIQEEQEQDTPLKIRLEAFSRSLTRLVIVVTLGIFVVGVATGRPLLEMLRTSIVLAIAAVPEGLLIATTVILVLGMRRILQRNGLVKKLLAVETLGSVTVICTDKTGTLTEGHMRVTRAHLEDERHALEAIVLCNDLEGPVDIALWEYARQRLGSDPQVLADTAERLDEEPFSSEAKFMVTANRVDGQEYNYLKGAPEIVLAMCDIDEVQRDLELKQVVDWATMGLRTLGLAYRPIGPLEAHNGYTWLGLVAMEDPIRSGVPDAIRVAQEAGIRVKMITGDYRLTAERVARNCGLSVREDQVIDGEQLNSLTDTELQERIEDMVVFARIRPSEKLRIVRALQQCNEVTAMIGDGVNDAPALKRANIGVVVGTATDVAKETADLILLDNNFATLVAAIEEGRLIFENIRKVVAYTLSNSFAEVLTVFAAMLLNWPAPLLVAQILWIHLICDGPADISLAFEPMEEGIMKEMPKSLQEPILNRLGASLIAIISTFTAAAALGLFGHYWLAHNDIGEARTIAFLTFAINSMIYIFGYRSLRRSILHSGSLRQNVPMVVSVAGGIALAVVAVLFPPLRNLLSLSPLHGSQWLVVFSFCLGLLIMVELAKRVNNSLHPPELAASHRETGKRYNQPLGQG